MSPLGAITMPPGVLSIAVTDGPLIALGLPPMTSATADAASRSMNVPDPMPMIMTRKIRALRRLYARSRDEGFGAEVKRRIMLGAFALSSGYYDAYYLQASRVRSLIARDFQRAFEEVDLVCTPTAPTAAFRLGEKIADPLSMYLSDIYTVTPSLAGLPALSVPCGFNQAGLPIGLQMIGNYLDETRVFQLAALFQKEHPARFPELS